MAPPLDQLPLRDALRADPQVVAALDDGARQTLADRLLLPRGGESADPVDDPAAPPQDLVARLDRARERRGQDALVAGALEGGSVVPALPEVAANRIQLPPLETDPAPAPTLEIESRALAGRARVELGALLARSGAHHLQRVVGWPVGAIAIGDRVYVNAAWLVALAPGQPGDGGADAGSVDQSGARAAAARAYLSAPSAAPGDGTPAPPATADDGGVTVVSALSSYDGGVYTPPPSQPPQPPPASSGDDCAAACASSSSSDGCGSSGGDDCSSTDDGSGDDCSSSGDGSGGDCSSAGDSGGGCETSADEGEGCAIARSRRHQGKGTLLTLALPLGFLLPRRRR